MIEKFYDISPRLLELDRQARGLCAGSLQPWRKSRNTTS